MKKLFKFFIVIPVLGLFMTTAHAGDKDVNIVNTPDVNVANQPTVNSAQSGSWEVNVTNDTSNPIPIEGSVEVVNTIPVQVEQEYFYREPFYKTATLSGTDQLLAGYIVPSSDIESGKILVVESINCKGSLALERTLNEFKAGISGGVPGDTIFIWLPLPQYQSIGLTNIFQSYQSVRLYLQSTEGLALWATKSASGGSASIFVTVTGYLIPDDSPSLAP